MFLTLSSGKKKLDESDGVESVNNRDDPAEFACVTPCICDWNNIKLFFPYKDTDTNANLFDTI